VFDLDGTLLDTMTSAPQAYADTIRALGGPAVSAANVVAAWHVGPTPIVLAHFLGRPASPEDIECFFRRFRPAVAAVRPFPGVVEMITTLAAAGHRLGIVTSATRRASALTLAATGLDRHFPIVVCGDDVRRPKPDPEGLWLACRRLEARPADAVYLGDADVDLQCAAAAGAMAILATWGTSTAMPGPAGLTARSPGDVPKLL
jgi:HAD superfamily hydrolase (TIGR01509 family)